jgi:hypothetical protein
VNFLDDAGSVFLVLSFTIESENVFRLAIRDFVDTEPFVGSTNETREVAFNIFNIYNGESINRNQMLSVN